MKLPRKDFEFAQLTERQQEVVRHLSEGLSDDVIAERMEISVRTARTHLAAVYKQSGFNSARELLAWFLRERA